MSIEIQDMAPMMEVFDMPTSLTFYRKLGFSVVADSGQGANSGWAMLELSGVQIMLNTQFDDDGSRPSEPDAIRAKWHHDTCIYFGCRDVDAAYEHFLQKGIDLEPPTVAPYGMKQLYIRDPDNYNLCFQWPHGS